MRLPGAPLTGLLLLVVALGASSAQAQEGQGELGLDLSDAATGQEQPDEFSLDLTSEFTREELLPRVVLLGLDVPERAGTAVASKWLKRLFTAIRTNDQWVLSTPPKEVRERLGGGYTAALRCEEALCMAESADLLEADLLVTARLALEEKAWTLRLWTYNPDDGIVEMDVLTGRSPREVKFQKAGGKLLAQRIKALAKLRAILKVNVNVPEAVVRLGEKTLGVGSLEARVPPVEANLTVEADEFTSYSQPLTFTAGEKNSVDVYLELMGPPPDSPSDLVVASREQGLPGVFGRPALYTAVVGVLAVGAGIIVGQQARAIARRAEDVDGDGIADITRRERIAGRNKANLATALVAGGGAVAGGSALWIFLVPVQEEIPRAVPVLGAGGGSGSTSVHLILGGNF